MHYFNNEFECLIAASKHEKVMNSLHAEERVVKIASQMKIICFVVVMTGTINDV